MGVEENLDQVLKANVLTWIVAVNPSIEVFSMVPLINTQALEYADLVFAKVWSKLPIREASLESNRTSLKFI